MTDKPKVTNSLAAKELDKAQAQFDAFDKNVKDLTMDRMSAAPKEETEPQHRMSQREIAKVPEHYLKPHKTIGCKEKFNEKYREPYEFDKQFVPFIAEHREQSDLIEIWTKPYAGVPAQMWNVPTNKPVFGPRFLAEQIKRKRYHRLVMQDRTVGAPQGVGMGGTEFYGQMAADTTIQRLDAHPVSQSKSVFMGAGNF